MIYDIFSEKLNSAFAENSLDHLLNSEKTHKLYRLACMLVETNKTHNLTAITDEDGIILKHFADCASICKYIPKSSSVVDIGCGAGFPTLPVAILREDIEITAIDSTEKKINFIRNIAQELEIHNISPIVGRAEEIIKESREGFDIAVSRAVARLNILSELCLPFIKIGGLFIAMKSAKGADEYSEARNGISILGAQLESSDTITLSYNDSSIEREIYLFKKTSHTPEIYPRNYSQISKRPIR